MPNTASVRANASVGSEVFSYYYNLQDLSELSHEVDEVFTLTNQLVAPGTTLSEDLDVLVNVDADLHTNTAGNTGPMTATADFMGTAGFDSVTVPEGVTWTSASGVFLPEPATLSLLALGGLAAMRRKR